jgi:hypothetical protein
MKTTSKNAFELEFLSVDTEREPDGPPAVRGALPGAPLLVAAQYDLPSRPSRRVDRLR